MRIAILTSGGDAPGMNAAIRSLAQVGAARGHDIFGVRDGYMGLMDGAFERLRVRDVDGISRFGGTILGSARSEEFREAAGRARACTQLQQAGIDGLVVVGGNGSLTGAHLLAAESSCRIVGIPASIDNDIGHTATAIGVDTAVNTIVEACDRISDTASSHRRAFLVEVMGRESGFLAMRAGIAAEADAIVYSERGRGEDEIIAHLRQILRRSFAPERGKRRVLIIKAEGVRIPVAKLVARLREHLADDAPGVTLRETVLGHLVRGGRPSQADRVVAQRLAFAAALALEEGHNDVMLGWDVLPEYGEATADPRIRRVALEEVIAETERMRDGTSNLTQVRVNLLNQVEPLLSL
jgi:6-phosphofructokinase 1